MWEWILANWELIGWILLLVSGGFLLRFKKRISAITAFFICLRDAQADDTITDAEIAGIVRAFKDVWKA